MRRFLIAFGVPVLVAVTPALAHGPVGAEPGPGATVGGEIDEVAIVFPELMSPDEMFILVTDPGGNEVPIEVPAALDDRRQVARVVIAPLDQPGAYRVDYRVSGIDGITTPGAFVFTFDPAADPPVPVPVPEPVLTASGPNWGAFGLGLVAAGAILFAFGRNARRTA
jgi:methionine-rich copper-binding protein CopC